MKTERLKELYLKYGLSKDDVFKHQHYIIITRSGVDKIQAAEKIDISYEVVECQTNFCVVKATASVGETKIQTFGSALKLTGFYSLGVFGEDESEDFKRKDASWKK